MRRAQYKIFLIATLAMALADPSALFAQKSEYIAVPELMRREHFIIHAPEDFYMAYRSGNTAQELVEYIPIGETVENWSYMLMADRRANVKPIPIRGFAKRHVELYQSSCRESDHFISDLEPESGAVTSWVICFDQSTAGLSANTLIKEVEVSLFRRFQTAEAFYNVQWVWHGSRKQFKRLKAEDPNFIENWKDNLSRVRLCDITGAKGPCEGYDIFNKENVESADARNHPDQGDGAGRHFVILEVKPEEGREDAAKFVTSFKLLEPGWDKINNLAGQRAQLWANYKSGGDSSLIVLPFKLGGTFSPEERRAAGNFAFLVRNALGGMGVPYSDMRVSYVHFHPKGETED